MTTVDRPATAARIEAADALRRLGHAVVAHDVGDDVFDHIATEAEELLAAVEAQYGEMDVAW